MKNYQVSQKIVYVIFSLLFTTLVFSAEEPSPGSNIDRISEIYRPELSPGETVKKYLSTFELKYYNLKLILAEELGNYINRLTADQKIKFIKIFEDIYSNKKYLLRLKKNFSKKYLSYKIISEKKNNGIAKVKILFTFKNGQQETILYRLNRASGHWQIISMIIVGMEAVRKNLRKILVDELTKLEKKLGFDKFLVYLKNSLINGVTQ